MNTPNTFLGRSARRTGAMLMAYVLMFGQVAGGGAAWAASTTITPTATGTTGTTGTLVNNSNASTGTVAGGTATTYTITGGNRQGGNLFHSFDTFNLGTSHTADFKVGAGNGYAAGNVNNVISRVLGGPSTIDGNLKMSVTTATGANAQTNAAPAFYFINPAGVAFTSGATISLPGAFYVSTANKLLDTHSTLIMDTAAGTSTFSSADPAKFGFLGGGAAKTVSFEGVDGRFTTTKMNVAAGAIEFTQAAGTTTPATLTATGGSWFYAAGAAQADVDFDSVVKQKDSLAQINFSNYARLKLPGAANQNFVADSINLSGNAKIISDDLVDVPGLGSASHHFYARTVSLDNAFISTVARGTVVTGASINVFADEITLGNGAYINAESGGTGGSNSGDVTLETKALTLTGASWIDADSSRAGNAGKVTIIQRAACTVADGASCGKVSLVGGSSITSQTTGTGKAGSVSIGTDSSGNNFSFQSLALLDASTIRAAARGGSTTLPQGTGGTVNIAASAEVSLGSGSKIASDTTVDATGGPVGITLKTPRLTMDRSTISSSTTGSAAAGNITLTGLSGGAMDSLSMDNNSSITSVATTSTTATGHGGAIDIKSKTIALKGTATGGSLISSETSGAGDAGSITLAADTALTLANNSAISTSAKAGSTGAAGNVSITAGQLSLTNSRSYDATKNARWTSGASTDRYGIVSTTDGDGAAGTVTINVAGRLALKNSSISTASTTRAAAGTVTVKAGSISMDPSYIGSSNTFQVTGPGNGDAGAVSVTATGGIEMIDSGILNSTKGGSGGAVTVAAGQTLSMANSLITSSVDNATATGAAGNINVAASKLVMDTGFIQANTNAIGANGGNVVVDIKDILVSGNSLHRSPKSGYDYSPGVFGFNVIQAASESGQAGDVNLSKPPPDNLAALVALATQFIDTRSIARDLCSIGATSSLTVLTRGGLPEAFDGIAHASPPERKKRGEGD